MAFAENLKQLPRVSHLAAIQLLDGEGTVAATIENKPGQTGSLRFTTTSDRSTAPSPPRRPAKGWNSMPSTPRTPARTPASIPTSTACWLWPKAANAARQARVSPQDSE
jgi:hypothetical protein